MGGGERREGKEVWTAHAGAGREEGRGYIDRMRLEHGLRAHPAPKSQACCWVLHPLQQACLGGSPLKSHQAARVGPAQPGARLHKGLQGGTGQGPAALLVAAGLPAGQRARACTFMACARRSHAGLTGVLGLLPSWSM